MKSSATAREMLPALGARVMIHVGVGELLVECTVNDVKQSWGNIRLLVTPVAGSGSTWIELSRLRLLNTVQSKNTVQTANVVRA